ncbi:hypothetical protein PHAVU_003G197100 [Phaseolus vulgaris]|uniref:Transmembrane protein n=1 Tax=Phaseolus vulgaris TaxID=3885 RepID=V7CDD3_PHAVU|nr:hypothetical protein PHAVU_003G197100g [Phaseolus vulgaris]ESW27383.1 hypothetical protein PHAVU_003G197100g [Phaseolus vulgaris]
MARTTLDFSSTFQRPHPTAIIMPSPSFPLSLTVHNHHHYPLKAPTPSFIRNIIIIIIHQHLLLLIITTFTITATTHKNNTTNTIKEHPNMLLLSFYSSQNPTFAPS